MFFSFLKICLKSLTSGGLAGVETEGSKAVDPQLSSLDRCGQVYLDPKN